MAEPGKEATTLAHLADMTLDVDIAQHSLPPLPLEILLKIISYFGRARPIYNFARCSRHLWPCLRPHLYASEVKFELAQPCETRRHRPDTMLMWAARRNVIATAEMAIAAIKAYGPAADVLLDNTGFTARFCCQVKERPPSKHRREHGNLPPLQIAVRAGHKDMIKLLVRAGAGIEVATHQTATLAELRCSDLSRYNEGDSPFSNATVCRNYVITPNCGAAGHTCLTPLATALDPVSSLEEGRSREIAALLLELGASPSGVKGLLCEQAAIQDSHSIRNLLWLLDRPEERGAEVGGEGRSLRGHALTSFAAQPPCHPTGTAREAGKLDAVLACFYDADWESDNQDINPIVILSNALAYNSRQWNLSLAWICTLLERGADFEHPAALGCFEAVYRKVGNPHRLVETILAEKESRKRPNEYRRSLQWLAGRLRMIQATYDGPASRSLVKLLDNEMWKAGIIPPSWTANAGRQLVERAESVRREGVQTHDTSEYHLLRDGGRHLHLVASRLLLHNVRDRLGCAPSSRTQRRVAFAVYTCRLQAALFGHLDRISWPTMNRVYAYATIERSKPKSDS